MSLESEALLSSLNAELDNARSYRLAFVILISMSIAFSSIPVTDIDILMYTTRLQF